MFFENVALDVVARAVVLSALALGWIIFVVRVVGLRAFSKMTAFDFVVTVATGSLLAGACQADNWQVFAQTALAMASLLGFQYLIARARNFSPRFESLVENEPLLLMRDGRIIEPALRAARVAEADLMAKLREANVLELSEVRAVVLETTGDLSVLHGTALEEKLLDGVRRGPGPSR